MQPEGRAGCLEGQRAREGERLGSQRRLAGIGDRESRLAGLEIVGDIEGEPGLSGREVDVPGQCRHDLILPCRRSKRCNPRNRTQRTRQPSAEVTTKAGPPLVAIAASMTASAASGDATARAQPPNPEP